MEENKKEYTNVESVNVENTEMQDIQVENNKVIKSRENNFKIRRVVYYIFGALEILFVFRLFFKILGANPESGFVSFIYTISGVFLAPFSGIFRTAVNEGIETTSVLEPATIIAMIVYALIAYGIVRLIEIMKVSKVNNN